MNTAWLAGTLVICALMRSAMWISMAWSKALSSVAITAQLGLVRQAAFDPAVSAIRPSEAQKLAELGAFMTEMIAENAGELFLIEGHTDAVGDAAYNLSLSDRRAESLALAMTEYFGVPPENMVVQGYGEGELLVPTGGDEPRNRRAVVRMISPLAVTTSSASTFSRMVP